MARIPISIEKINTFQKNFKKEVTTITRFMITLNDKNDSWTKHIYTDRKELERLRAEINEVLESETTAEKMNISVEKAAKIDDHYKNDSLCLNCKYQFSRACETCLFVLQSPLERKLFIELKKTYINFQTQQGLNYNGDFISMEGKSYDNENNNFKNVLTIVDFYIYKGDIKLCVYTDGHTYHERTEEQAQRDRNIDRKLQELGFKVLRYTGKEVNENIDKIISDIKRWIKE
ncbi:endonuclease domain-containing protein [Flavobacterium sp.]|uniref:endonuclease domain-containing protein n=1 Tax=Flavobacterium sp. TaxID=239 RepID=UPI0026317DCE|nr:DUF559 domain-containing protein [Flavobacterium sp.]